MAARLARARTVAGDARLGRGGRACHRRSSSLAALLLVNAITGATWRCTAALRCRMRATATRTPWIPLKFSTRQYHNIIYISVTSPPYISDHYHTRASYPGDRGEHFIRASQLTRNRLVITLREGLARLRHKAYEPVPDCGTPPSGASAKSVSFIMVSFPFILAVAHTVAVRSGVASPRLNMYLFF